ncbi:MAG: hypothetical protein IKG22_16110 [Atopobiaceae bacterium]|nr:hypothetical protein [Atopobiaceae bacterium]
MAFTVQFSPIKHARNRTAGHHELFCRLTIRRYPDGFVNVNEPYDAKHHAFRYHFTQCPNAALAKATACSTCSQSCAIATTSASGRSTASSSAAVRAATATSATT